MTVHQLLRFYPRAWRDRYGDEFAEVVGSGPLSGQQTMDILMGAVDAWTSRRARAGAGRSAVGAGSGGDTMIRVLKTRCMTTTPRYTTRDALISAGVLILATIVILAVGKLMERGAYPVAGDVMKNLAFPLAMTISMPFAIMKGQPRRAQIAITSIVLTILFFTGWLSTKI